LQLTNKIKETTLNYVSASAVVVDRGPFRDLPRNYPENKTLEPAEQKGSYTHNTTQEGMVAI